MRWLLIAVLFSVEAYCQKPVSESDIHAIDRAHAATEQVRANFKKALTEELGKSSPAKALSACKIKAPEATADVTKSEITEIGRTSHRLRNPKNAPKEWVKPYLEKYASGQVANIPKQTLVPLSKDRYGYIEPIFVEPICLNCHGGQVDPEVHAAILKEYPEDKAVGFKVGDFRGLLWLEMTAKK